MLNNYIFPQTKAQLTILKSNSLIENKAHVRVRKNTQTMLTLEQEKYQTTVEQEKNTQKKLMLKQQKYLNKANVKAGKILTAQLILEGENAELILSNIVRRGKWQNIKKPKQS